MRQLVPRGAQLSVEVRRSHDEAALVESIASIRDHRAEIILDGSALAPGSYVVDVRLVDRKGRRIGKAAKAKVAWRERSASFERVKVLNNFVMELFNGQLEPGQAKTTFYNPRDGWVFFSLAPGVRTQGAPDIVLDGIGT